ncbi:MAG: response regulator [Alicyclobacillus sp.]|nr:response regulator [Alicyclobacillus sp.]
MGPAARKGWSLLLTVALIIGAYFAVISVISHSEQRQPMVRNGVLDLSRWDFSRQGMVTLNGWWTFYPHQLVNPSDIPPGVQRPNETLVRVPGSWTQVIPAFGVGTYAVTLKVGDTKPEYALKLESAQMASRVYVNGRLVGSSGRVTDGPLYEGKNVPYLVYFALHPGWNEILVQVANFDFGPAGGISLPLYFGYASQMSSLQAKAVGRDACTFTLFAVMGLYYIGLSRIRRSDRSILFFGLLCLTSALYTVSFGQKLIYTLFPHIPYWLVVRIQTTTAVVGSMMILLYVYHGFRAYCSRRMVQCSVLSGILIAVLGIFALSTAWGSAARLAVSAYVLLMLCYSVSVLVLGLLSRAEGSLYMLLAAVALLFYVMTNNLSLYFGVPLYTFPPVDAFVLVIMFALLVALRFARAFEQNERLSLQLRQANLVKDEFLSKTAHEFKTPLHGIISIAESILSEGSSEVSGSRLENIELVWTMARRLSRLVYDILDFTHLQQGQLAVTPDAVNVHASAEVLLKVYALTTGPDVQLVNRVPPDLPAVLADEDRLRQILTNLLDNAIKHTPSGNVEIRAVRAGDMVDISVADTGNGIDEADLPFIFEPFRSLDKNFDATSFGLGLSIVKQLVELQQGRIRVESVKGEGSCFTVSLPVAPESPCTPSSRRQRVRGNHWPNPPDYALSIPYVSPRRGAYTILVVDDRYSNLKILIDALEQLNYGVIAVDSGEAALRYLADHPAVDLVVLDLMMPGLSGLEVCKAIRATHSPLELPVVMVTASIQAEAKLAAFAAGSNDYLSKPFDMAELKARIRSLLMMKESAAKATEMEVAFLQSQIKPHFLFNVLNTVLALSYTDAEKARKLITDLSEYLRGSFSTLNTVASVPFRRECALIRAYVEIERARFQDRVRMEYDIPAYALDVLVPPLTVQPLVENAIRHGIAKRVEGGTVAVRAFREGEFLVIEVEDDGVGMTQAQLEYVLSPVLSVGREGVGLSNIRRRLKYTFNTDLTVTSRPGSGTRVRFKVPVSAALEAPAEEHV